MTACVKFDSLISKKARKFEKIKLVKHLAPNCNMIGKPYVNKVQKC